MNSDILYAIELNYNGEISYLQHFVDDDTDFESTEFLEDCGTFQFGKSVLDRVNYIIDDYNLPCTARLLKVRRTIEVIE